MSEDESSSSTDVDFKRLMSYIMAQKETHRPVETLKILQSLFERQTVPSCQPVENPAYQQQRVPSTYERIREDCKPDESFEEQDNAQSVSNPPDEENSEQARVKVALQGLSNFK